MSPFRVTGEADRCPKSSLNRRHRLAVELDKAIRNKLFLFPASQVGKQPRRDGRRGLSFFGSSLADWFSIKDAALQVDKRAALFGVRRCRGDRASARARVYVASAVLLFAHGRPEPLLDGNMARVLDRVFEPRRLVDIRYDARLQSLARLLVRSRNPAKLNWAILDLAARHCTLRSPGCEECPLRTRCNFAIANGSASKLESPSRAGLS